MEGGNFCLSEGVVGRVVFFFFLVPPEGGPTRLSPTATGKVFNLVDGVPCL